MSKSESNRLNTTTGATMLRVLVPVLVILATAAPLSAQSLTITNATVVDVATGALRPGTTVIISGNRIVRVEPSSVKARTRGRVVDATGMFVIPGLWDMHTHAYFGWSRDFGDTYVLPLFIANGITGIRDMGSALDAVLRARREVAAHRLTGPRMVVSGPMLDGPQVTFNASTAIATPEDGRRAVDLLKAKGVDFIKIQSGLPRDAYLAIAAEAKKLGIAFDGHVPDAIRASEAVAAGQRTFEHLIGIFEASTPDEEALLLRRYGAGTDTPAGVGVTPGISVHLELQRFVAAGFTPLEALQTATINPARFFGKMAEYGSVEAGHVADLVLLRANPLDNIANTRAIDSVIADGQYYSQADINALRERLKKVAGSR